MHINELSIQGNEITTHFLQHLQNIISIVSLYLFHLILMTRFPSWSNYSHLVIVVEDVVASIFSRYLYGILLEKNAVLNYRGNVGWLFPSNDASSLCKVSNEHSGVFARRQKVDADMSAYSPMDINGTDIAFIFHQLFRWLLFSFTRKCTNCLNQPTILHLKNFDTFLL